MLCSKCANKSVAAVRRGDGGAYFFSSRAPFSCHFRSFVLYPKTRFWHEKNPGPDDQTAPKNTPVASIGMKRIYLQCGKKSLYEKKYKKTLRNMLGVTLNKYFFSTSISLRPTSSMVPPLQTWAALARRWTGKAPAMTAGMRSLTRLENRCCPDWAQDTHQASRRNILAPPPAPIVRKTNYKKNARWNHQSQTNREERTRKKQSKKKQKQSNCQWSTSVV